VVSKVAVVFTVGVVAVLAMNVSSCGGQAPARIATGGAGGPPSGPGGNVGGSPLVTVGDAGGSPHRCSDLFDQSMLPTYSIDISADNWTKLDADFHDVKDVLAGTPPQTYYPIVFHYGSEVVSNAAIRLRGKSSWVNTVMLDANPKMQFVVAFDQIDPSGKFHGISTLHFEMPRDDWTFLNDRIGNNWLREIGQTAPCSNSAKLMINGSYYGLYVAEGAVNAALLRDFFPDHAGGDLFKGGTEAQTNLSSANWPRLQQLRSATTLPAVEALVDIPSTLLEWAAEAALNDADGYYGGSHNYYLYDEGGPGYVWLADHTDSALEWLEVFTPLSYQEHPIYWWAGRPSPDPPGPDYLIVLNDPTMRAQYTSAIATQVAKWNTAEISGWIDTWSGQVADAVAEDPRKWATPDQFTQALAALRDVVQNRPRYLQSFVNCENGVPADSADRDGDGVPWCNDCNDNDPNVHPGAREICGNGIDDDCNGLVDDGCPAGATGVPSGAK
jgi:hypothetical protein